MRQTPDSPSDDRFGELAAYNARVRQGIVHTAEFVQRMAALQAEFDDWINRDPAVCGVPLAVVHRGENWQEGRVERSRCGRPAGHKPPDAHAI